MLQFASDSLATGKAVFAVIDAAKSATRWDIVSSWCDRLDRKQLATEPNMIEGRKGISEAERWYFAKVKALVELKQWAEARVFAKEATANFPHKVDFYRWAAQARARQGDLSGGVEELEEIIHRGRVQWYILSELAELQHELGQNDHALGNACKAALAPGEDRHKVRLYELLTRIHLQVGKLESAGRHVELAKAVRQREGWGINNDLAQLERQVNEKMANAELAETPLSLSQLFKLCRRDWEEGAIAGQARHVGHVSRLIDGKDFAFIAPEMGGDSVYVKLRDLPRAAQKANARVEYSLVNAYDKKKERDTVRATDVRLLE
jgi:cold shock CspA family protein